ncbi:TIGR01440 family protein [Bacillus litorisediminis]|uniref:TIGR01440 family protein n=1 Tax=Bacillus litorisediminis TaxID=2922713 RepID=UPI001FAE32FC|nr:TIGR01440 family protein [Bacillus litorisediminis]
MDWLKTCQEDWKDILHDFESKVSLNQMQILVIGCSTSEIAGKRIGTAGTEQVAEMIFKELQSLKERTRVHLAFQCCEHLNRALVVEEETAEKFGLEEVTVVPVRNAGGAMATFAYQNFKNPVVVESIKAHAGIDIGDTFIGMHLKPVVVPIRTEKKQVGHAHVTLAKTRPKLIGGERAVYVDTRENKTC